MGILVAAAVAVLEPVLACIAVLLVAALSLVVCMGVLPALKKDEPSEPPAGDRMPATGRAGVWLALIVLLIGAYVWWLALGARFFPAHGPQ